MNIRNWIDKLAERIPDPDNSGLADLIRKKAALLSDKDLQDIENKINIPAHGWYFPDSESWAIPLIKSGDTTSQKRYLMLPAEIVAALPAGENNIGRVSIQGPRLGNLVADVRALAGFNWLNCVVRFDGAQAVAGTVQNIYRDIDFQVAQTTYITGDLYFRFPYNWPAGQIGTTVINKGASVPSAMVDEYGYLQIHGIIYSTDTAGNFRLDYEDGGGVYVADALPVIYLGANQSFKFWSDIPIITLSDDQGNPELSITTPAGVFNHSLMLIGKGQ